MSESSLPNPFWTCPWDALGYRPNNWYLMEVELFAFVLLLGMCKCADVVGYSSKWVYVVSAGHENKSFCASINAFEDSFELGITAYHTRA